MGKYKDVPICAKTESKVIGYFAYNNFGEIFCSEDACIVAGSEELMREYFGNEKRSVDEVIRKIRFGEIMDNMREGVEYAFDRESYGRFSPLAKASGLSDDGFLQEPKKGMNFIMVKLAGF